MTKNAETMSDEAAIWTNRTEALLGFIEEEIVSVETQIRTLSDDLEHEFGQDADKEVLKIDLEKKERLEFEDFLRLVLYQFAYEQRQREASRRSLKRLKQFTKEAAAFLKLHYDGNEGYSPRYLWRVLLNEASTDLQLIQAAVQQRTSGGDSLVSSQDTLFMADIISEHALGQAVESGFLKQTPIITYLKKDTTIRSVPYAGVALISVAYASMQPGFPKKKPDDKKNENGSTFVKVSRDMLAIPHEIGHHLFWHGHRPGKMRSIDQHLQKRLKRAKIREWDWRRGWLEEIFADAYGCLVAGPVMALSFQELLSDNLPANFREDTGHHPIPALRPYIQNKILHNITDDHGYPLYRVAPKLLDKKWEERLTNSFPKECTNIKPLEANYKLHDVAQPMTGQQILEALDEIIKIVLRTLRGQRPPKAGANWTHGGWKSWTTDLTEGEVLGRQLFDNLTFANFYPFRSHWLQLPAIDDQANAPQNWPDQIRSGWSVEGPEDKGG